MTRASSMKTAALASRLDAELDRGDEKGDLRDRFCDAVVDGHGYRLAKRHHPALEELVVVGSERIGREVLADVAVRGLVEIRVGGLEACEEDETPRPVAALLAQLALGRRFRVLTGLAAASRQLPRVAAREMTELANEQHVVGIDERHHADRDAHVQHGVAPLAPGGQPPRIFPQRELAELRERARA